MIAFLPQGGELAVIVLVLVVLFGGSQIPKLARSLGQAQREFKDGLQEGEEGNTAAGSGPSDSKTADESKTS